MPVAGRFFRWDRHRIISPNFKPYLNLNSGVSKPKLVTIVLADLRCR